jgi:hypothetical protein
MCRRTSPRGVGRSDFKLWLATQCVDYIAAFLGLCFSQACHTLPEPYDPWRYAQILVIQGHVAVLTLYLRERFHFWLLRDRLPACKTTEGGLSRETWLHVLQTAVFSQISFFMLNSAGLLKMPRPEFTWKFWGEAYLQFYTMLILRDVFSLAPFHTLMHSSPRFYQWHKKHHQVRKNAQSMHAFHIDLVDLVLENTGAPSILLLAQYLLGFNNTNIGVHYFAVGLLTAHDGGLHSVNPFSAMYFNPFLDHILKGNICHQLHHALNKDYIMFVPYRHMLSPAARQSDIDKYQTAFKTDFILR